jgi:septum formation protein
MAATAAGAGAAAAGAALASRFKSLIATHPRIILGTASSSRRFVMDQVCKDYSFSYEVIKADIDEKAIRHDQPRELVLALAHAKADAIIRQLQQQQQQQQQVAAEQPGSRSSSGFLITCDQVVVHEGQIREKPEDIAEAHR